MLKGYSNMYADWYGAQTHEIYTTHRIRKN